MNTGDLLLRNILANPADDTARLVYADWLEEHGESERAEFIRVGVNCANGYRLDGRTRKARQCRQFLRTAYPGIRCINWLCLSEADTPSPEYHPLLCFNRGFAAQFVGSCDAFMQHAEAIFRQHPVMEVRLTDKEPHASVSPGRPPAFWWYSPWFATDSNYLDVLPKRFFINSSGAAHFNTVADAYDWLSARGVSIGRELAELPPLGGKE